MVPAEALPSSSAAPTARCGQAQACCAISLSRSLSLRSASTAIHGQQRNTTGTQVCLKSPSPRRRASCSDGGRGAPPHHRARGDPAFGTPRRLVPALLSSSALAPVAFVSSFPGARAWEPYMVQHLSCLWLRGAGLLLVVVVVVVVRRPPPWCAGAGAGAGALRPFDTATACGVVQQAGLELGVSSRHRAQFSTVCPPLPPPPAAAAASDVLRSAACACPGAPRCRSACLAWLARRADRR